MKKILQKSRAGFSLIELLVVIVIIGILSVAFLPTVLNAPKKARDATRKAHINAIAQAVQAYYSDNALPADTATALAAVKKTFPNSTLPNDPSNNTSAYLFEYNSTSNCFAILTPVAMDIPANANTSLTTISNTTACNAAPTTATAPAKNTHYALFLPFNQ